MTGIGRRGTRFFERGDRRAAIVARGAICLALLVSAVPAALAQDAGGPAQETPGDAEDVRRSDLIERATARLALIDVTANGPPEAIASLTRENFTVKVGLRKVLDFNVDRVCPLVDDPATDDTLPATTAGDATRGRARGPAETMAVAQPASYILYFDQTMLTAAGRHRSSCRRYAGT